jgi:hypothetical protein
VFIVEFKRKKGESFENFLRRFNKRLISSGKLYEVRRKQFLVPKKNKTRQKTYALASLKLRSKKEYLRKIGKLKDEPTRKW